MKKILVFIVLAAGGFAAPTSAETSRVTIAVDVEHPGAAIQRDFSGLSFEISQLRPNESGVRYFRPDNVALLQLFHTLGIQHLRIGGNTSDRDARQLPAEADLDSLFAFAKSAGIKVIYCLRLHDGDPQADAAIAKYILLHYAAQLDCFSIGQEPSAYPVERKDTRAVGERMGAGNEKFSYADYAAEWRRFAAAITAAAPDVKFCGPGVHNNGAWAQKFMADFGKSNHVVLITEHLYPGGAGGKVPTPQIGIDRMLSGESAMSNSFPRTYQKLYDSFVPAAAAYALPYRLEEVNNYFNGGATNVSNTFASALWGLDFMYWWAAHGAAGLNFHTGDKVAAGSELRPSKYTAYFSSTNGYLVRPLGYGIKAFDLGGHGQLVPASLVNPDHLNLSAYAVLGPGNRLFLTVINKEHGATARDADLSLASDAVRFRHGQVIRLTTPNGEVAATVGELLGGAPIQEDGNWNGHWLPLEDWSPIAIPSASAAIIQLTP